MTGILPIKKYGTHQVDSVEDRREGPLGGSALNMFTEYSMADPGELAAYFGFTEKEVQDLCRDYGMSFDEAKAWYDGYQLITHTKDGQIRHSMYSPRSVVEAMLRHRFGTYWNQTETYEALKVYIQMDMDGLKDAIVEMLAGEHVRINTGTFHNKRPGLLTHPLDDSCFGGCLLRYPALLSQLILPCFSYQQTSFGCLLPHTGLCRLLW